MATGLLRPAHLAPKAVAAVAALARKAVAKVQAEDREVLGLTVGVAGMVDSGSTKYGSPRTWAGAMWALREALIRALDTPSYPVAIDNDANLAVRAEHRYGSYAGVPI